MHRYYLKKGRVTRLSGGLKELPRKLRLGARASTSPREIFAARPRETGGHGSMEWAVTWYEAAIPRSVPTATQFPHSREAAPQRGRFSVSRSPRGSGPMPKLTINQNERRRRRLRSPPDDGMISSIGMLSVFHSREPEFVRPDRRIELATGGGRSEIVRKNRACAIAVRIIFLAGWSPAVEADNLVSNG